MSAGFYSCRRGKSFAIKTGDTPLRFLKCRHLNVLTCYSSSELDIHQLDPANNESEEITITCPHLPDGTPQIFRVPKSILMRSPTLKNFFRSEHYLPGCEMQLTFMLDPGACIRIALLYLEKGVDVFNQQCIDLGADAYSNPIDQFHILIRLYLLATSMRLPRLADMTYQGLLDRDNPMQAAFLTTLAGLVFAKQLGQDDRISTWCTKHLCDFAQHLKALPEWQTLLPSLDKVFQERWDRFMTVTESSSPVPGNNLFQGSDNGEEIIQGAVKKSEGDNDEGISQRAAQELREDSDGEEFIRSVVKGSMRDIDEEIIQVVVKESKRPDFNMYHSFKDPVGHQHKNSDADWDNRKSSLIGAYIGEENKEEQTPRFATPQRSFSRRAKFGLRLSPITSKEKVRDQQVEHDMAWADEYTGSTSPDVAKAVRILGMNDVSGNIISRSKRNRVDRVIFKLTHKG